MSNTRGSRTISEVLQAVVEQSRTGTLPSVIGSSEPETTIEHDQARARLAKPGTKSARELFEPRRQELWTTFCSHHGAAKLIENGVWTDDLRMLKEAQAELEVIQLDGTTRKQIGRIIDLMAEMFSADVPSADALTQWFKLLEP